MKTLALFGGQDPQGLTAQLARITLAALPGETTWLDLNDWLLSPDLDALVAQLAAADVWLLISPTYFGSVAGALKQALDRLRPRLTRMTQAGDTLPGIMRGKVYPTITSCFASGWDNYFTHQTDGCLTTIDQAMSAAGLRKAGKLVLPGTWGIHALPPAKGDQALALAKKNRRQTRKG